MLTRLSASSYPSPPGKDTHHFKPEQPLKALRERIAQKLDYKTESFVLQKFGSAHGEIGHVRFRSTLVAH